MNIVARLITGFSKPMPSVLQTEATECGLACLVMIAGFHGLHLDLAALRRKFPVSLKGTGLSQLIKIAGRIALSSRAVRVDFDELDKLRLPCILHWEFNHFVVLKSITAKSLTISDPAQGERKIARDDASKCFTGVVLELWPTDDFVPNAPVPQIKLRSLVGRITGLKRSLLQIFILALALELFSLLSPLLLQWVLDNVVVSGDRDFLKTLVVGFGFFMLIQQGVGLIRAWSLMHLSTTLGVQWKLNVFSHLVNLPISYFEKRHAGDVVSRFSTVDTIQQTLTSSFIAAILDGLMTTLTLAMMWIYSPTLGAIVLGAMMFYVLGRTITYRSFRNRSMDVIVCAAKTQSHFLETIRGMKAIQLFQRQNERQASWIALLVHQVNAGLRTQKFQMAYQQWNAILFGMENLVVIYFGALMVMDGAFSVGMFIAFNAYKAQFDTRAGALIDHCFSVKMLQLQGERLADIVLTPVQSQDERGENDARTFSGEIEFLDVYYRYGHGEQMVLNGIDLRIEAGECVAIVGPTGCGKTTLIHLLLGIISPIKGQIKVDGVDVTEVGAEALRKVAGTVMQDDVLFAGSLADNISFFDCQANHAWIVECAQQAGVHDEILAMPMGYNTLVGDMGSVLSGGQKQRVLLARALYKRPAIVLLDEATCHLNVEKEQELLATIRSLSATRIIVAHRPETIAAVDRVILMGAGKVVWSGRPFEMMNQRR